MEEPIRKPFEGVTNIIRFNWHFYVAAFAVVIALFIVRNYVSGYIEMFVLLMLLSIVISVILSLATSFYVYDCSQLYSLNWINSLPILKGSQLININAGFDETSALLSKKYPAAELTVFDFYDPQKHTEVSIARARKRYAVYSNTINISTSDVPLQSQSADYIFAILSAHEIRNRQERISFFTKLKNGLKDDGKVIVAEHIRNVSNLIAYNIGFFHFFSETEWKHTFRSAGLSIEKQKSVTPFIHVFFLHKNEFAS